MKRRVNWTPPAVEDVTEQAVHIAQDDVRAARRMAEAIFAVGDRLGNALTGRPGRITGTYEKSVPGRPYVIAYALRGRDDRQIVEILRMIHTARNRPEGGWPKA